MSETINTNNDIHWEYLFLKYNILTEINENGFFKISAQQIKERKEPRLMTKIDHKNNLPRIFKKNRLSILPISRGDYLIGQFDSYHKVDFVDNGEIEYMKLPETIESIDVENITREGAAILCAYNAGILSDFLEEEFLYHTVNGRMGSGSFEYNINSSFTKERFTVKVDRAQIEIDGGFEGLNTLALIEAKNSLSSDFLVRQLYYAYRLWTKLVSKTVNPVFMTYTNGIFDLYLYGFKEIYNYNSIELIKHKKYAMQPRNITIEDILTVLNGTTITREPEIPFPQADSFIRVINLCELLHQKNSLTREEVTLNYDFDVRQTNYYTDAARYLGLIIKERIGRDIQYSLSTLGKSLFKIDLRQRQLLFIEAIIKHRVFNEVLKLYIEDARPPRSSEIVRIMMSSKLYNVNGPSTIPRRARTVKNWIDWILSLQS